MPGQSPVLKMRTITKEFPGVKALDEVSFDVLPGEIHALVGENGAGKSTLMKVLSGVYPHGTYSGQILLRGQEALFQNIKESEKAGIAIIFQELNLIAQMNICENIFLGSETGKMGVIDWDRSFHETTQVLKKVGLQSDPVTLIRNLGVGEQQLVEIARSLSRNAEILIFDEPTAALTEEESENLLSLIRGLKEEGKSCIYISHRLKEVFKIADRITVLRDGKTVGTKKIKDLDENKLINMMVGRELKNLFPPKKHSPGTENMLEIRDWTVRDTDSGDTVLDHISFSARKGEILGFAGLMGAGRTELMLSLIGAENKPDTGSILLEGNPQKITSVHDAIKNGICYLSEDRKEKGLILNMSVAENTTLASLENLSTAGVINKNKEIHESERLINDLKTRTPSVDQITRNLSGGNQQKVCLAKWLLADPKILILDEPTRGIDVGAKYEIYTIMNDLAYKGVCVIMISSELPEILGMSDRILVMKEGRITAELPGTTDQKQIMYYCTVGDQNNGKRTAV